METLKQVSQRFGTSVEIILFGTQPNDPGFVALPRDFPWSLAAILTPKQLANLMNEVDIFVDFSTYQAMGLTALEAMACGVATIVPVRGGANAFAKDHENSLVIDTSSKEIRFEALKILIQDHLLRSELQNKAIQAAVEFCPEKPALNILSLLF